MKRLGWCVLALWAGAASATGQPLTLEAVLATADAPHPDLDLARARQDVALADVRAAESLNDFRVTLEASLRSGRNEIYDDHYQPDHFTRVVLRKTLWDDGRQQVGRRAVGQESEALGLRLLDIRAQRRLSLMAR